jgi:hypothetical protein
VHYPPFRQNSNLYLGVLVAEDDSIRLPKNEKSPPDLSVKQGQIGGWEFAMLSFPRWLLGAPFLGGCQLPDAILHGKRSLRPRSRAVQRLASAEF